MNYSIGEFSEISGLSIYTLRYYEHEGLINPERKANGQRIYTKNDIAWVEFIVRLKETGMPIKEIQRYAVLRVQGELTLCERRDMLLHHRQILQDNLKNLNSHLEKLDAKIEYYENEIEKLNF